MGISSNVDPPRFGQGKPVPKVNWTCSHGHLNPWYWKGCAVCGEGRPDAVRD